MGRCSWTAVTQGKGTPEEQKVFFSLQVTFHVTQLYSSPVSHSQEVSLSHSQEVILQEFPHVYEMTECRAAPGSCLL
jgi:hypothetical protein